ncbi:MAG: VUT family protein, partial [Alphaproteobacteria bacterium]|nr:VUT family protein [Alphaproteobacteria bacterium]
LWLRSFLSTATSSLLDNIIFSVLAWKILMPLDIDTRTLIFTYILGTYTLRFLATGLNAPVMYLMNLTQERKKHAIA